MWYQLIAIVQMTLLTVVHGHGRLLDPPSRASMWRYGFGTPHNYDDNQLYCGGVQVQYEQNGGRCGVCGDPWNAPRENEPPGRFATGKIVRKYSPGQVIKVVVELTANHKGFMEFKICPNDDPTKTVTQECLDRHILPIAETNSRKYYVPNKNGYSKIKLNLVLPSSVRCKACVFQWKYNAGNSWGTDKETGRGCLGCGNQEQFYGCADIAIGHDDITIVPHKTLPADIDDDDNIPHIDPKWKTWTPNPTTESTEREWELSEKHSQTKTQVKDMHSFSFMPVMNNNGMSPCMCICKRAPLKLNGGAKNNLEAKFFDGLDGQDNQVCMCMCQSSALKVNTSISLTICSCLLVFVYSYVFRRR